MGLTDQVAIVGVGDTDYTRGSGRSNVRLAVEAALGAARDAGIDSSQIDGIVPPYAGFDAADLELNLQLHDVKYCTMARIGGASSVQGLMSAAAMLSAGVCEYVLAIRARNGYSERTGSNIGFIIAALPSPQYRRDFDFPQGFTMPAQWYAMIARRHIDEFGTTSAHLGEIAVAMRHHANLNPHAQMHGRPLTLEDHANSRLITDPYRLLDCCVETDGGAAVVLTTTERARRLHADRPVVTLAGMAEAHPETPNDLVNRQDWFSLGVTKAAPRAFEMASARPDDMDAAMIYDPFTFQLLHQLEEIGFCSRGEGGRFVSDGGIKLGGRLPVNTHGGLMSEGHVSGMNHVVEAVRQLRGECGERQVPDARHILVSGWGDYGDGAIAILRRGEG